MTQQPISLSGRAATEFPGEYLLGQILDHSGLLVSVKDGERRFVRVSRRLRELLTATCADPIGKTVFEVLPEPFARRVDAHDCSVFAQGRAAEFEEQLELGGVCRTLLTTRLPLFGPGGTVCGVCSISTDISERKRIEEALRNVALGVSGAPEQDIYCQIVRYLALTLRVDFAFIGILSAAMQGHVETLAIYSQGHFEENTVYPLAGTPCAQVIGGSFQFVPDHLHERYPADGMMQAFGFESYAAYPLFDSQGRLLGLIAVLDRKPMSERDVIESILRIFAVRAAVELEREQADRARQLSEASYREIFEASEDAIFIHDFDTGTILDVNPKACQAYGYTVEEMRSLDVGAISSGEPFYTLEHAIRLIEHAKVGETVRFEWHRRNKDGSLHWDEVVLKRAMLAGQPRILAFTREISERKQAEAALRASEEQYRAIFNASVDGIAFWNPDGRLVDLNPAFARMHGYSREELLRMDPQQFVHPTSWDQFQRFIETLSTGQPFHTEARSMRSDGTAFDVEVNGIPMEYQGAPHLLAIVRDISERKRAEAALRASEEQYRAIFNASVDGVTFWNAKGRLVDLNPAFARMYGYDREELLRMDPRAFIHSDSWGQFNTLLESLRTGRSYHAEARGVRRDGTVFDVEVSGVPLDYRGAPHLLAIVREITERREAERERSRLEAQLRQAQKMEAIGHLTGGIAHDFNNILTSILGYTVLALEREAAAADPRLGRYLEQIRLAGERARDLIRQMLTFSRGQRGEPRPLLLSCLIK
ncbi:MAG TPA: PAS domain S-box protein, partial [Candidatus Competibacteraceae bacterium]|nr:PAS domain S-box protein [Candidatus Competibacteraceae bacterium]